MLPEQPMGGRTNRFLQPIPSEEYFDCSNRATGWKYPKLWRVALWLGLQLPLISSSRTTVGRHLRSRFFGSNPQLASDAHAISITHPAVTRWYHWSNLSSRFQRLICNLIVTIAPFHHNCRKCRRWWRSARIADWRILRLPGTRGET